MNSRRTRFSTFLVVLGSILIVPLLGCGPDSPRWHFGRLPTYPRVHYSNPALRAEYEQVFNARTLDPIEGFWQVENESVEITSVVYRMDAAENSGFPFAERTVEVHQKVEFANRLPDLNQVLGRWKPTNTPNVYRGQTLVDLSGKTSWRDLTATLIDPTTIEVSAPGGIPGRVFLIGPKSELERRLKAVAEAGPAKSEMPTASAGSGFLIELGLVVTSQHVVRDAQSIRCFVGATEYAASVIAHDDQNDVALLKLEGETPAETPFFTIGDSARVVQGERVFAMGYPLTDVLGKELRVHEGIISSVVGFKGRASEFQVEMTLNPGNSGGPLVDEGGSVVGIVASKLSTAYAVQTGVIPEGVTFAIKADSLRSLLSAADVLKQVKVGTGDRAKLSAQDVVGKLGKAVVRVEASR